MPAAQLEPVVRFIRDSVHHAQLSDTQLLTRFAADRDEGAFSALVRRHGPLVFGVCRRALHDAHAAEDAFQATFLLLARKASSLACPERLSNWLFGVACRVAARAMETLKDQELKTQSFLGRQYEQIRIVHEQIRANRAQREAFGEQLRVRHDEYKTGRGTLDILLEAQRFWADALSSEYSAIATYNNALASFEFAKGTTLKRHKISMEEIRSHGPARPAVRRP